MLQRARVSAGPARRQTAVAECGHSSFGAARRAYSRASFISVRATKDKGDTLRRSFDSEDDLDQDLADELRAVADPQRAQKLAKHFDLMWKIGRPGAPKTCDCCKGRKESECNWCHGTGYLMVGSQVFPSTPTHTNNCPVCKGKGYTSCERCRGTGFRATWLPSDSDLLP